MHTKYRKQEWSSLSLNKQWIAGNNKKNEPSMKWLKYTLDKDGGRLDNLKVTQIWCCIWADHIGPEDWNVINGCENIKKEAVHKHAAESQIHAKALAIQKAKDQQQNELKGDFSAAIEETVCEVCCDNCDSIRQDLAEYLLDGIKTLCSPHELEGWELSPERDVVKESGEMIFWANSCPASRSPKTRLI